MVPEIFVCALALEAAKTRPAKTKAILRFVKVVSSDRFVANGAATAVREWPQSCSLCQFKSRSHVGRSRVNPNNRKMHAIGDSLRSCPSFPCVNLCPL